MGRVVIEAHPGRPVLGSAVRRHPRSRARRCRRRPRPVEPQAIADALAELIGDRVRLRRLADAARAPAKPGWSRPTSMRPACWSSSSGEAGRDHAAGRPRRPGARRDRPDAARARRTGRRARGPDLLSRPADLPRNVRARSPRRCRRSVARAWPLRSPPASSAAGRRSGAHGSDLRRPRRHSPARSVSPSSCGSPTGGVAPARSRGTRLDEGAERRAQQLPAALAEGDRGRARDRRASLRRPATMAASATLALGRTSPAKGIATIVKRRRCSASCRSPSRFAARR